MVKIENVELDKIMEKDSTKKEKIMNLSLLTINQLRNTLNMNIMRILKKVLMNPYRWS